MSKPDCPRQKFVWAADCLKRRSNKTRLSRLPRRGVSLFTFVHFDRCDARCRAGGGRNNAGRIIAETEIQCQQIFAWRDRETENIEEFSSSVAWIPGFPHPPAHKSPVRPPSCLSIVLPISAVSWFPSFVSVCFSVDQWFPQFPDFCHPGCCRNGRPAAIFRSFI